MPTGQKKKFPKEQLILLVGEVPELSAAIGAALTSEEFRVRQILPGKGAHQLQADRFEVDLSCPASLAKLAEFLHGAGGQRIGSIINFLGLTEPFVRPGCASAQQALEVTSWTFNLAKAFEDELRASADDGGGWFINVTGLGGRFALEDGQRAALAAAGTLGVAKTLVRECPQLTVKNIDVDPSLEPHVLASRLLEELAAGDDLSEVGLTATGRFRLALERDPIPRELGPLPIDAGSVILVTGGAYGVTAEVAKALAVAARPRLILVGRSARPAAESPETRDLDAGGLRKRLIEQARTRGERLLPAQIERALQRILKDREIRANLAACEAAGATVEYHALDVRDADQLGGLLDDLYARFGRLDGVVHGAGVIEDKRIRDKTPESFANVFRTKVASALTLVEKLRPESLKFVVFFSSVSGRFGNTGQVDYSAANEFLNKLADHLDSRWPGRVVSINWGPWDGGMVSDELRRMYATVGFDLIPIDVGARFFLSEVRLPKRRSAEVIVSGSVDKMLASGRGH